MSPLNILVTASVLAVLLLATCAIVAVRRWWRRVDAEREATQRRMSDLRQRIIDDRAAVGAGVRAPHGARFTLTGGAPAAGSRSDNSPAPGTSING